MIGVTLTICYVLQHATLPFPERILDTLLISVLSSLGTGLSTGPPSMNQTSKL
jgi:hypothetical protein